VVITVLFCVRPRESRTKEPFLGGQNAASGAPIFTPFYPKLAPT